MERALEAATAHDSDANRCEFVKAGIDLITDYQKVRRICEKFLGPLEAAELEKQKSLIELVCKLGELSIVNRNTHKFLDTPSIQVGSRYFQDEPPFPRH